MSEGSVYTPIVRCNMQAYHRLAKVCKLEVTTSAYDSSPMHGVFVGFSMLSLLWQPHLQYYEFDNNPSSKIYKSISDGAFRWTFMLRGGTARLIVTGTCMLVESRLPWLNYKRKNESSEALRTGYQSL